MPKALAALTRVARRAALAAALLAITAGAVPAAASANVVTLQPAADETTTLRMQCNGSKRTYAAVGAIHGPPGQHVAYRLHAFELTRNGPVHLDAFPRNSWAVGQIAWYNGLSMFPFSRTFTGGKRGSTYLVVAQVLRYKTVLVSLSPIRYENRWVGPYDAWPQGTGAYQIFVANPWVVGGRSSACHF